MERGPHDKNLTKKEAPYGWVLEHYHKAGLGIEYTMNCWQCKGTGFDSLKKECPCCTCYGVGKVFVKNDKPVDCETQRKYVQKIQGLELSKEKK